MAAVPMTGMYGFVADRMARGRMMPTALFRANRTFATLPKALARTSGRFRVLEPVARTGAYRTAPISLALANAYVTQFHRHLNGVVGHLASLALADDTGLRGVVIIGRPVARYQDDGATVEILRACTDGSRNACSKLYGAVRRWARRAGKRRIVTYTLPGEGGASLKAAGFVCTGRTGSGGWGRPSRQRVAKAPICAKLRWELLL